MMAFRSIVRIAQNAEVPQLERNCVNSLSYKDFDVGVTVAALSGCELCQCRRYLFKPCTSLCPSTKSLQFNSSIGASIYRQHDDAILSTEKNFTV